MVHLLRAERAWARAEILRREEGAVEAGSFKHRVSQKLKKAAAHARDLCGAGCCAGKMDCCDSPYAALITAGAPPQTSRRWARMRRRGARGPRTPRRARAGRRWRAGMRPQTLCPGWRRRSAPWTPSAGERQTQKPDTMPDRGATLLRYMPGRHLCRCTQHHECPPQVVGAEGIVVVVAVVLPCQAPPRRALLREAHGHLGGGPGHDPSNGGRVRMPPWHGRRGLPR